jgi:Subtilase family
VLRLHIQNLTFSGGFISVNVSFRNCLVRSCAALFLCELGMLSLSAAMLAESAFAQTPISEKAIKQIAIMQKEKASRSPTQKKIDSQLLYEMQKSSGKLTQEMPELKTGIKPQENGKVLVDIKAKVSDDLLQQMKSAGGDVIYSSAEGSTIRANLPMAQIESLASSQNVASIEPAVEAQTQGISQPKSLSLAAEELLNSDTPSSQRLPGVVTKLAQGNVADGAVTNTGSVNTQGDVAHGADLARSTGATGKGVKIGVLSDSYNCQGGAEADISSGDLPAEGVTVLQEGVCEGLKVSNINTDEGRAMLQIIHDLAPDAKLYFASGNNGGARKFADNIRALRAAGCDVIVDNVIYSTESPFQDGPIAQAVNEVVDDHAIYLSAAGNFGSLKKSTSRAWEANFVGQQFITDAGTFIVNNFGNSTVNPILDAGLVRVNFYWSDPLGASTNDYDLVLLDSTGAVKSFSDRPQDGSQDPYEAVLANSGDQIVLVKNVGAEDRYVRLDLERAEGKLAISTSGAVRGHAAAEGALSVASVDVATAAGGRFTGGAANPVEGASSDGPRRIFYTPNGTPITPGNLSATGGTIRNKPDLAAADNVSTTVRPDSDPFLGTSAAASHAAAIAALLKSANPALGPAEIRTALTSTALDIEDPGADINSGAGIIDALQALTSVSGR